MHKCGTLSASDRSRGTKRKQSVGKEHLDKPMLDMRNNNGSLEYCDIIVVLKDITYFKNTLRFHFTTLSHPKKSSGSLKYTITMDSVVVRFVTLYEKSSKCMVQPLDYNEGYLLCLLKELPKVFKLQQSLADSLQL